MSIELHVRTRQQLLPDPEFDPVEAIFFTISSDLSQLEDQQREKKDRIEGKKIINYINKR